jgi:hypothetical protein
MWFDVWNYPNFIAEGLHGRWKERFERAGFKTYKIAWDKSSYDDDYHWLDDYEFTWFVLRYS